MKRIYKKPIVTGNNSKVKVAFPAALAGLATALVAGVAAGAGASARKLMGSNSVIEYRAKKNIFF